MAAAVLFAWSLTGQPVARSFFSFWYLWSGLVGLLFFGGWFRGHTRRQLLERTKNLDELRAMRWQDFELLVGEYYRRAGFRVSERGGGGADGGVDLELRRAGETLLVQCKRWKERVIKVQPVRELWGVVSHEGASGGVFVTSGRFTSDALAFAEGKRYQLVDGAQLLELVAAVRSSGAPVAVVDAADSSRTAAPLEVAAAPSCPRCGSEMAHRTGVGGRPDFWGCTRYPACRGLIPIGATPAPR